MDQGTAYGGAASTVRAIVAYRGIGTTTLRAALRAVLGRGPDPPDVRCYRCAGANDAGPETKGRPSSLNRATGWIRRAQRCGLRWRSRHPIDPRATGRHLAPEPNGTRAGSPSIVRDAVRSGCARRLLDLYQGVFGVVSSSGSDDQGLERVRQPRCARLRRFRVDPPAPLFAAARTTRTGVD